MCGSASIWAKVALLCAVLGTGLHCLGWATNYWLVFELPNTIGFFNAYIGLWWQEINDIERDSDGDTDSRFETDMFNAVRALETITLALSIFGTIILFVYVIAGVARKRFVAICAMIVFFIAGTSSAIGLILLLIEIDTPYMIGWSAGMTTIASPLFLIAATLLIPDIFDESKPLERPRETAVTNTPPRGRDTPLSVRGITTTGWTP